MLHPFTIQQLTYIYECLAYKKYPKVFLDYFSGSPIDHPKKILDYYQELCYDYPPKEHYNHILYQYITEETFEEYDDPLRGDIPIQINYYMEIKNADGFPKIEKEVR